MKRTLLAFAIALCSYIGAYSQATSMTIDCQTPGWLSSMIDYADQQTVRNLKVTGYINATDLKFIGSLIQNQVLNEQVDLSDVNVVGDKLEKNTFGISKESKLRTLRLPNTVKSVNEFLPYYYAGRSSLLLPIDTLYFNCDMSWIDSNVIGGGQFGEMPKNIIISEKTDSIPKDAFNLEKEGLEYVKLPKTIRYIGDEAFSISCNVNFNELESLEYLGRNAFSHYDAVYGLIGTYQPDTIIIPHGLKDPLYLFAFAYRDGQHIFIEDNITEVSGYSRLWGKDGDHNTPAKLHFHINNMVPPSLVNYKFSNSDLDLSTSYLYVPKGSKEAYLKSDWKNATIIEVNPLKRIDLNIHDIMLKKEEQISLSVNYSPTDADNKDVEWASEDSTIASVNRYGDVTALKAGETWIIVRSAENQDIKDSCKVKVEQPVTGVSLSQKNCLFGGIGESVQLEATVLPADATNKEVNWKSSNESVCIVSHGQVVAVGYGTAVIIATTVDGGYMATCTVTVTDMTPVSGVDAEAQGYKVYDLQGRECKRLQKGINIIRFLDGTTKKMMIK